MPCIGPAYAFAVRLSALRPIRLTYFFALARSSASVSIAVCIDTDCAVPFHAMSNAVP